MTQTCTQACVRTQTVIRSRPRPFPRTSLWCVSLALCLGIVGILGDTTNPVFIQRDLPPAPYAYGLQDFDSSEEVTIVKRSGQTMLPGVTYLTTPQSLPTPLGQVQVQKRPITAQQQLPLPLPLQQQQQKQKQQQQQQAQPRAQASTEDVGASEPAAPAGAGVGVADAAPSSKQTVDQQVSASNVADQQTSLIQVELESVPRPEDLPQPAEAENSVPHKRNVYDAYATEAKSGGGCGCGGYVLVEKKIYVCEPKETIVRLMKRSHDVCAAQETQHVGVIQSPDNDDQQRFQLIPIPEGMEQQ